MNYKTGLISFLFICILLSCPLPAESQTPYWATQGGSMQRTGLAETSGPIIGCIKWRFDTAPEPEWPDTIYAPAGITSSVTIGGDGTVYFSCEDGYLYALYPDTQPEGTPDGQLKWKHRFHGVAKNTWHWPMNEGQGDTVYAAAGDYNGSLHYFGDPNGGQWVEDATFGHALSFDGINDCVRIDGFKGIGGSTPRHISFNVKQSGGGPVLFWGSEQDPSGRWAIYLLGNDIQVRCYGQVTATGQIAPEEWTRIEVVLPPMGFRASDTLIYVNGNLIPINAINDLWIDSDLESDVYIGYDPLTGAYFQGLIADMEIEELEPVSGIAGGATIGPDGTIYAGWGSALYAINPDGSQQWQYDTDGFLAGCAAVSDAGRVFFGSADGNIYAVNSDGSHAWDFNVPGPVGGSVILSPSLGMDGSVYAGGLYNAILYALDPNDGSIRWECDLTGDDEPDSKSFTVAPVVASDGTIYAVLTGDTRLYAINPTDGSINWATDLSHKPELLGYWKLNNWKIRDDYPECDDTSFTSSDAGPYKWLTSLTTYNSRWRSDTPLGGGLMYGSGQVDSFVWPANTTAWTVTAWFRIREYYSYSSTIGNVLGWELKDDPSKEWAVYFDVSPASLEMRTLGFLGTFSCPSFSHTQLKNPYSSGTNHFVDPTWHHIAVMIAADREDGTSYGVVYVDGQLYSEGTASSLPPIYNEDKDAKLIVHGFVNNEASAITLDDTRLYRAVLNQEQIREIMHAEIGPTWPDPEPGTGQPDEDRYFWSEPAIGPDGTIYAELGDSYLRAIRPDGTIKWIKWISEEPGHTITVTPNNRIYAASADGRLILLDADGKFFTRLDTKWLTRNIAPDGTPRADGQSELLFPTIAPDGSIYVSDIYNRLWAVPDDTCEQQEPKMFCWPPLIDSNRDCLVNLIDMAPIAKWWMACTDPDDYRCFCEDRPYCPEDSPWTYIEGLDRDIFPYVSGDLNRDHFVNLEDLAIIIDNWLFGHWLYTGQK
ncbi:MAG: PQQ-binding-like beta-propeller repeat protein [Sedimentisphaerales bacterium]|nr:PQQ-binding-like beta-propeller repeat protein [Sedimentisphaerales bacterium]